MQTCMIPTPSSPDIAYNSRQKIKHLALKCCYCTSMRPCSQWPHAQPHVCLVCIPFPTFIVMNQIPPTSQLQHIPHLDNPPALTNAPHTSNSVIQPSHPLLLGGRIPPIPPKLHKKIIEGHYIDMAELFPEHLEALNAAEEDHSKSSRPKLKDISSILDWIQAFSIYMAILKDQPHRVPSLLAYQHLLIHSHTNFKQFNWVSYDR